MKHNQSAHPHYTYITCYLRSDNRGSVRTSAWWTSQTCLNLSDVGLWRRVTGKEWEGSESTLRASLHEGTASIDYSFMKMPRFFQHSKVQSNKWYRRKKTIFINDICLFFNFFFSTVLDLMAHNSYFPRGNGVRGRNTGNSWMLSKNNKILSGTLNLDSVQNTITTK